MQRTKEKIRCRWSPTLGALEDTAENVWGTIPYNPETDRDLSCVFFGIYGLPDFIELWRHRGKKWILWAGTDIIHFRNGYFLEEGGLIRLESKSLAKWINKYCENWCENTAEQKLLKKCGVTSKVCPSFLGDVKKFKVSYQHKNRPVVYASVSGNNFKQYGWDVIERIAPKLPKFYFVLFGNTKPWKTKHPNVYVQGRTPQGAMNDLIEEMQCGLRPLEFDGASEILIKSVLMGQYPISRIAYSNIASYKNDRELIAELKKLKTYKKPNLKGRNYYLRTLNKFPWTKK